MPIAAVAYLGSFALSTLGNSLAAVALPLVVLAVTGSPAGMATVALATAVPSVLAALLAGSLLDRLDRRTCSIAADVVSAASVAAVPLVGALGGLSLPWLVVLAAVGALGDAPGMTARETMVPAVARASGVTLERLIGLRESAASIALLLGPAAAGTLMALLDASTVLLVTAATSALAAAVTLLVPRATGRIAPGTGPAASTGRHLVEGLRVLLSSRFLVGLAVLTVGLAVVIGGLQGAVLPVYFDALARPDLLGLGLSALAGGLLLGAAVYAAVGARVSRAAVTTIGLAGSTVGFVLVATLLSPWLVLGGAAVLGLFQAALGAVLGVQQAEHVPEAVRGRVLGLQNALLLGAAPLGVGLAGFVAAHATLQVAGLALVAVWVVLVAAVVVTRALRAPQRATRPPAPPPVRPRTTLVPLRVAPVSGHHPATAVAASVSEPSAATGPGGTVVGRVRTATAVDAAVTVVDAHGRAGGATRARHRRDGHYRLDLPGPGTWQLIVSAPGHTPHARHVVVEPADRPATRANVDLHTAIGTGVMGAG